MPTATKACSSCGAELPSDAPAGLCPKCLLAQGLEGDGAPTVSPQPDPEATLKSPRPLAPVPLPVLTGYRILKEISRGGQAVVYEGIQESTKRKVAIKVLQGGAFVGPKERARFEREVQVLAALNHPNIVQVIDRGTTADGSYFLVMPYISGMPLDKWLHAYYQKYPSGPPPDDPSELLRLFTRICAAVNAAHLQGVVHRDLKPSNIRMDDNGEPHILDFGLARTAVPAMTDEDQPQPVTITGQFLGSLPWAAPEQAEGAISKIDMRTDVYALGVILYQMLTGRFPYEVVGNMADVLKNIQNAKPTPPSTVLAGKAPNQRKRRRWLLRHRRAINGSVDAIILKALAKLRDDRYQSAGDFAHDLSNYLAGRPVSARRVTATHRLKVVPLPSVRTVVCISACIMLAAMLWAVMQKAREAGKRAQCANNLRQWGVAWKLYVSDHGRKLLGSMNHSGGVYPGDAWVYSNTNYPDHISAQAVAPYVPGVDWRNRRVRGIWLCPSADAESIDQKVAGAWNEHQPWGKLVMCYAYFAGVSAWAGFATYPNDLSDHCLDSARLLMADYVFSLGGGSSWRYNHGLRGPSEGTFGWLDFGPPSLAGINKLYGDGRVEWKDRRQFNPAAMDRLPASQPSVRGNGSNATFY